MKIIQLPDDPPKRDIGPKITWQSVLPATSSVARAPAAKAPTAAPTATMAVTIPSPVCFLDIALSQPKRSKALER